MNGRVLYKVQALDRAFAVLDLLGERHAAGIGAGCRVFAVEEEHRAPLPDGSGAAPHGWNALPRGSFAWGLRLFDLGNRSIEQYDLRDRAQPRSVLGLVGETEETGAPCILEAARHLYRQDRATLLVRRRSRHRSATQFIALGGGQSDPRAFLPEERVS